jgi:prolyl oligopeptidase
MRHCHFLLLCVLTVFASLSCATGGSVMRRVESEKTHAAIPVGQPAYPPTRTVDEKDVLHGVVVGDPYRWLEDGPSAEVRAWSKAQDEFAREELSRLPGRETLAASLRESFNVDAIEHVSRRNHRTFYTRRDATKEKAVVYWKDDKQGEEKVLLDPNTWSRDGSVSLGQYNVSWDGTKVAYKVKKNNADEAKLQVMDIATGTISDSDIDTIDETEYTAASWTPSGDGFYYVWAPHDPSIRPLDRYALHEVRFHELGTDPKKDPTIKERTGDPRTWVSAFLSRDGHWFFYNISRESQTELWFQDARRQNKHSAWLPLTVGRHASYKVAAWKDFFYVRTDEGAPHYRMFRVDPYHPEREAWKEIVPERPGQTLTDFTIVGNHLSLVYLTHATSHVEVHTLDGALVREVPLPGLGTSSTLIGDEDDERAYYIFRSFTSPKEIHEISVRTGESRLWYRPKVSVDASRFVTEQVFFASKDGTRIPMFILRGKNQKPDGETPVLLSGYGGFGISLTPGFHPGIFAWLARGGIFAMPNLRGGGEYGEEWHRQGMRRNKQNVFDDFIAAAEHLVAAGWTRPGRIAIRGASNGGLLVGAVMTQRPELFGAVICGVPLLDMIRVHGLVDELGSPADPDDFRALYAYSPYHRIKPGVKYPPVLLLSADSDDRVDPMHARKFAARLQASSTSGPVLLRIEHSAGHYGADLMKAEVERYADELTFAFAHLGVKP